MFAKHKQLQTYVQFVEKVLHKWNGCPRASSVATPTNKNASKMIAAVKKNAAA